MSQSSGRGGVSRVVGKLKQSIQKGNYYEAHQMYRTLYSRYSVQNKHDEVQSLMESGAFLFFRENQNGSGVDLSLLLLDSLEKSRAPVTEKLIGTVGELHKKIGVTHPHHEDFEVKAITWTTLTEGVPKMGHKKLRGIFARNLWQEQSYGDARQHFLYSDDGTGSGEMLIEFSMYHGTREEDDLFIVQFVLQLLCIRSKQTATQAFNTYTEKHPRCEAKPPFSLPLLNFVFFLFAAIERQRLAMFTALCDKYQTSLKRDPKYFQYLEKIGEHYFGIKLPKEKKGPKGLIGNLLQGLLDGGGGDEGDGPDIPMNGIGVGSSFKPATSNQVMTEEDLD